LPIFSCNSADATLRMTLAALFRACGFLGFTFS
jgi:hypothetical protein